MWTARAALAVALTFAAPTSLPHPAPVRLGLNACTMVPARVLAAAGVTAKCQHDAIDFGPYGLRYEAAWNRGESRMASAYLGVSIVAFFNTSSSGYRNAREGLAVGGFKKVSGIGSAAYESVTPDYATHEQTAQLDFIAGSRIVSIDLDANSPIRSLAPLQAVAKAIAKRI